MEEALRGELVTLRAVAADDAPALLAIRSTPEVLRWWGRLQDPAEVLEEDDSTILTIEHGGRVVGAIQWSGQDDPDFRHAGIDVYLDPTVHGRGLCADAVRTLARFLIERHGYHRLVIDPAADNRAAIRCYERVGFKPVGVLRRYWRDPDGRWRDGLLMDLLAEELT